MHRTFNNSGGRCFVSEYGARPLTTIWPARSHLDVKLVLHGFVAIEVGAFWLLSARITLPGIVEPVVYLLLRGYCQTWPRAYHPLSNISSNVGVARYVPQDQQRASAILLLSRPPVVGERRLGAHSASTALRC